jgi:hypothetical protein
VSRLLLHLSATSGLSSFVLFVGDANTFRFRAPNSNFFPFSDCIFIRILSKEYGIIFPERESIRRKLNEKVFRNFQASIKVSYSRYSTASSGGTVSRKIKDEIGKSTDETLKHGKEENAVKKTKMKSFARIPLQHDEYLNVRLSIFHVI